MEPDASFSRSQLCEKELYMQTELFKKSAMEKELSVLNALTDRQREQYAEARRSVELINRKCHELKVQIAALEKLLPEGEARQTLNETRQAIARYDDSLSTGSEALDVVLAAKKMACEARGIWLNCIADGACVDFIAAASLCRVYKDIAAFLTSESRIRTKTRRFSHTPCTIVSEILK